MKHSKEEYWHWFHGLYGISQQEKEELLRIQPEAEIWFEAGKKQKTRELLGTIVCKSKGQKDRTDHVVEILESVSERERLQRLYEVALKKEIKVISRVSKEYPSRLKNISDAPLVLYCYGHLPKENVPSLAVIGARSCSVYGEEIATRFSEELSESGIQIISGMARGIDAAAQRSAIKQRGRAYAVLGSGVDVCYPKENIKLYNALCMEGGVLSEELPGTGPYSRNFPKRNRVIAGLSDAVFLIEARERSGSLITVTYALEQGKEIFAVPGRIYESLAEGTNKLIQEGAYLVRSADDILQYFKGKYVNFFAGNGGKLLISEKKQNLLLETNEKIVYACLSLHPKHIEQICTETGIDLPELTCLLFEMEMKHYIKQPLKNYYMIQS